MFLKKIQYKKNHNFPKYYNLQKKQVLSTLYIIISLFLVTVSFHFNKNRKKFETFLKI